MPPLAPLEIEPDLWLIDTALYHPRRRTLVLADLHLGYEAALHQQGVLLPETHFDDLLARLEAVFAALGVCPRDPLAELLVNGDLRHTFGPLNAEEWRQLNAFFERVAPYCRRLRALQGNHDAGLQALAQRHPKLRVHARHAAAGWLYAHGDSLPELDEGVENLVIGHEHPALTLRDPVTGRRERFKAFLRGEFRGRALWVLPSSNGLVRGTDLAERGALSPVLQEAGWRHCLVYARDDQGRIYPFGPLDRLIPS